MLETYSEVPRQQTACYTATLRTVHPPFPHVHLSGKTMTANVGPTDSRRSLLDWPYWPRAQRRPHPTRHKRQVNTAALLLQASGCCIRVAFARSSRLLRSRAASQMALHLQPVKSRACASPREHAMPCPARPSRRLQGLPLLAMLRGPGCTAGTTHQPSPRWGLRVAAGSLPAAGGSSGKSHVQQPGEAC